MLFPWILCKEDDYNKYNLNIRMFSAANGIQFPFAKLVYTNPLARGRKKMGRKWTRYTLDTRSHACRFAQRRVCVYGEEHQELLEGGRRSCSQNRDRDAMSVPALSVRFPPSPSLSFAAGHEPILWKYLPSILNITLELVRLRSGSSSLRISLSSGILISLDEGWTSDEGLLGRVCIYIYIYSEETSFDGRDRNIFPNRNSPDTKTIDNRCCDRVLKILFIHLLDLLDRGLSS